MRAIYMGKLLILREEAAKLQADIREIETEIDYLDKVGRMGDPTYQPESVRAICRRPPADGRTRFAPKELPRLLTDLIRESPVLLTTRDLINQVGERHPDIDKGHITMRVDKIVAQKKTAGYYMRAGERDGCQLIALVRWRETPWPTDVLGVSGRRPETGSADNTRKNFARPDA